MKKLSALFVALVLSFVMDAQLPGEIVGIHGGSPDYLFASLDLVTQQRATVSSVGWRAVWQGNSTYDQVHHMYFSKNGYAIYQINAKTGQVIDSLMNLNTFNGIEYDETCDCLVGIWVDTDTYECYFSSIDFSNKALNKIAQVSGQGNYFGESTYDQKNRRYFRAGQSTIEVLDNQGSLYDVIPRPYSMSGFEYDEIADKLIGFYFGVTSMVLTSVEVSSHQVQDIDSLQLNGLLGGESTFDQYNERYFFKAMDGIHLYDLQNHAFDLVPDPFPDMIVGMEYKGEAPVVSTTGLQKHEGKAEVRVYPNPGHGEFFFRGAKSGETLRIVDAFGKEIYTCTLAEGETSIHLEKTRPGIYFYQIFSGETLTEKTGKLIIR